MWIPPRGGGDGAAAALASMRMSTLLSAARARFDALPGGRFDAWLAAVLAVAQLLILWKSWGAVTAGRPAVLILGVAVALAMTLPLAARRRAPFTVFAVIAAATFAHALLPLLAQGVLAGPAPGPLVALYSVAAHDRPGRSWVAAGVSGGWLGILYLVTDAAGFVPFLTAVLVACWVSGRLARTRALYVAELERDREARARLAVADERARIARELHDVIAHAVSVVHVQARAARGALHTDVRAAEGALEAVEHTAGQALGEMRLLLGALRDDDAHPERSPQPSITDLDALVDRYRHAGLPVRMHETGDAGPLPTAVGVAVYRIVQESLTNALKHATPSEVTVRVGYDDTRVQVEVVNDGAAGPVPRQADLEGGLGLAGMRERTRLLGGHLSATAEPAGRFRVHATLPVDKDERHGVELQEQP